jgi:hypothetical protein
VTSPAPRPDAEKLIYATRMLFVSAGLFAIAGVIWLVSGNGVGIGVVFVGVAVALAAAARAVSMRT